MPWIEFQNKKVFYRVVGKGRPVVLVHGFAENGNVWNRQIDALKEDNLLIIPDLPGSGSSEMLDGNILIKDYAEVLKSLVDQVVFDKGNHKRFSMIGHSMGGYITLAFAEKYPDLLNSFGLFHSTAYPDTDEKVATRKKAIEFILNHGTEAFLKMSVPNLFCDETKKTKPGLINQLVDMAKIISPEALIQYSRAMIARPDRSGVLKAFSKPVFLIAGFFDTSVPLAASLEQFSMPAIATVHILKHSAHMGMWEEAALSNEYLANFLNLLPWK